MRRLRLSVAAVAAAALVLAGCGGGDDNDSTPPPSESPSAPTEEPEEVEPATWPLTGLPVDGDGDGSQDHPVYVVKIDNTGPASPQVGLSQADLVVEALVEGGSTRLAAFYYSELPEKVGPVRSLRNSDVGIAKPVDGEMVASGGAGRTVERLRQEGVTWHGEGAQGVSRDRSRRAPYNVFVDLNTLASGAEGGDRPTDYLVWGTADELPEGVGATSIGAKFSGLQTSRWSFSDGGYRMDNNRASEDDQFIADSVLVIRAELTDAGYTDPAGNPVPETKFEGSGEAVLFHDGKAIEATWEKDGVGGQVTLQTPEGELKVPAGRTWIELIPTSGSVDLTYE